MSLIKGWTGSLRCVIAQALRVGVLVALCGCVSTQALGDRAFSNDEYGLALEYYEQAIAEGTRDPYLYYRAAQAATNQGAFPQAERYYSLSLRHGGDVRVARALAQFYVQTSNFVQAVRVYQYLMRVEQDVQPVYSNMGAALMYSGRFLDAESFMLIAQQMKPSDPVPYINLGVLYDRHIRNRPRAVAFYRCFTELTSDVSQRRQVQNRLLEMGNEGPVDTSRVGLSCGETYRLPEPVAIDLREALKSYGEEVDLGFELSEEAEAGEIEVQHLGPSERSATQESEELEIAEDSHRAAEPAAQASEPATSPTPEEVDAANEARALGYYEDGRYDDALRLLRGLDARSERGDRAFGLALYRTGRFAEAIPWLELSLKAIPTPTVVQVLLDAYRRQGQRDAIEAVCGRFEGWPDYEAALASCPGTGS